jgi:hypothetical protein
VRIRVVRRKEPFLLRACPGQSIADSAGVCRHFFVGHSLHPGAKIPGRLDIFLCALRRAIPPPKQRLDRPPPISHPRKGAAVRELICRDSRLRLSSEQSEPVSTSSGPCHPERSGGPRSGPATQSKSLPRAKPRGSLDVQITVGSPRIIILRSAPVAGGRPVALFSIIDPDQPALNECRRLI